MLYKIRVICEIRGFIFFASLCLCVRHFLVAAKGRAGHFVVFLPVNPVISFAPLRTSLSNNSSFLHMPSQRRRPRPPIQQRRHRIHQQYRVHHPFRIPADQSNQHDQGADADPEDHTAAFR